MTAPTEPPEGAADRPVDLGKHGAGEAEHGDPYDPYRFGLPEHLPPPEYAPPGWTPPGGWPAAGPPPAAPPPGGMPPPGPSPFTPGSPPPPGYSPYPYGYPPPPPQYSPYQPPPPGRGKAVTAFVLGILSIVMSWASFLDAVLIIAAVTFGVIALTERPAGSAQPRGMAIAGLVCAGIGAVLAIVWTVFVIHAVNQCGGFDQTSRPGFRHCLQQQF
jgi:VanZ family protein